MQPKRRSATFAVLSAAVLFFAAAPAQAQGLVSVGSGTYLSPATGVDINRFAYFLTDQGNGTARGYAVWFFPNVTIVHRVSSFGFFEFTPGTTSLAFAGPIVAISGTLPPGAFAAVGRTAFTAMNDDGHGSPDGTAGFSVLPPQFGNLATIQQIVAFLTAASFPPPFFAPLLSGNIWFR